MFLKYLPHVDHIKTWTLAELSLLAEEIRQEIISVLSVNGGHLSSNLGTVELSIALHYVFSSPKDRFIFDVSHQTYPHKLLTGRLEKFSTIRQFAGLCGFADPSESSHDHFYAGHAGTALSLALGAAHGRDLQNEPHHVIPILGDAALTCGVTLEALNNIPKDLKKFIVVLNDNKMSISENVGNITGILSRLINHPISNKLYHDLQALLGKIPGCGENLAKQGQKLTESMKNLVSPAVFFEQFGLDYVGPIDGHDLGKLVTTFRAIQNTDRPVLLHVMTTKGKGMPIASENPTSYHGVKPFDTESGLFLETTKPKITFPKAFGKKLLDMAEKSTRIVAITPAMPAGSCLTQFMKQYPERCFDVGIAESHSVTFAGGIAKDLRLKVYMVIYATFLQRALDNLFHDVCLQSLPVVFAIDRAFISGPDGSTHHGIYDLGFLYAMPHLIVTQPRSKALLEELLDESLSWTKPAAIRYPNLPATSLALDRDREKQPRPIGQGEILAEGSDVLLISLGHMCETAFAVKELLAKEGQSCAIVDPIYIKPLDASLFLRLFRQHSRVVVIEEHASLTGLSSILSSFLLKHQFTDIHLLSFGVPDEFVPHGQREKLLHAIGLTPLQIAEKILKHFCWNEIAIL